MTKLLQNKPIIKFLGIALSILLIVALVPQINIAYGSKDDVLADTGTEESVEDTSDSEGTEGTEDAEGEEEGSLSDGNALGGETLGEEEPPTGEEAGIMATALSEENPETVAETPVDTKSESLSNNEDKQIIDGDVTNTSSPLTFSGNKTYTLTVNGTLHSDIKVTGGAKLTINGAGTIVGKGDAGQGSVIVVEGKGSKLVFDGPTVKGGTGRELPCANQWTIWGKVGGGILVCRATESKGANNASLEFKSGVVEENKANAGGGIFIDNQCGFTMSGGTVQNNTALAHEGGGIFIWGNWNGESGNKSEPYCLITGGQIKSNETKTTTDWGGGGIYINNEASLRIDSAKITNNTAESLGGGVAGCPHAKIGIGEIANGAAVYANVANGNAGPANKGLKFNMPKSITYPGKEVPSGDFLVQGITGEEIKALSGDSNATELGYSNTSYKISSGSYAKDVFDVKLAQDFYCTYASFIGATNLGDHPKDENGTQIAWDGFIAGVPANKVVNNKITEKDAAGTENWRASTVSIPVNESYEVHDATLCLTSTAEQDNSRVERPVVIEGNKSSSHGGGISCNGTLQFGTYPQEDKIVNNYTLGLTKEVISGITKKPLALTDGDRFTFTLTDKEDGSTYTAVSNEKGEINFTNLPGLEDSATKEFTLKETDSRGLVSSIPGDAGVAVEVELTVETSSVTYGNMTTTTYTTTVSSVKIGGETTSTVTNTLNLKASVNIPVTKVADGIPAETFTFGLKDVTENIDSLVDQADGKITLKDSVKLAEQALASSDKTATIEVADSTTEKASGTNSDAFTFDYAPTTPEETHWYAIAEQHGRTADVSYDDTAYLVKVDVKLAENQRSLETTKTIWKTVAGESELVQLPETEIGVTFNNVAMKYAGFNLGLTKQILTTLGKNVPLNNRTFSFALYEGENPSEEATPVAQGATDATGKLDLRIADGKYAKEAFEQNAAEKMFTFTLKETPLEGDDASFTTTIEPATVKVTLAAAGERTSDENGRGIYLVTPTVKTVTVDGVDVEVANNDITVTNRYAPNGTWRFRAEKFFYGLGEPSDCSFSLVEIERAPGEGEAVSSIAVKKDLENNEFTPLVASVTKDQLAAGNAVIEFPDITYVAEGKGKNQRNDIGDHYYLVTENGDDAAKDTTAYVVKVTVAVDENDPAKLAATETELYYADDLDSALNPLVLPEGERPTFYNTDTYDLISAASYSVYAASGEPVDQVCYVDPKIVKNLEGRAIKSGEFAFKLIQVASYNDTEGELISATTNDEFGMVDFDKANNVSGDLENPSCLAYTKPGTYYYRVIEDTSKGGMNDQSVLYSDQVITFTTVIKQDEATGQLVCTDMYYGWWDAATNQNVRFDEQYADYETQPGNIGDMSKLNPDWHPTINNKARPMDLQVRKTSVSDRDEGLVGATYALYMVNENPQGDIWLAEATSEEGGWITYKNVSLATNNLYYFKETVAPAGHTVSEFRSPYFYLVEDATSANGYSLKYTDTKYFDAAEVEAAAIPMAAAEAQAMQADIAVQAEAAATDDQTQPGHSADGNILLTYDKDGGVYDETTQVEVNKLDTRTHEWVEGAKLVILEKESGKEVASWTSGKAPQKLAKTLNVGITYLLREVEAPGEYRLANDVEFVIDNYGNVTITKGTENGNAELSDNTITLYDTMMDAEEVEQRERETTREVPLGTILAQTGDMLPILGIGVIVLASLIALIVAGRRRREGKDDKN
ncbi:Spy0128 family protein [Adlercreutzia equolifaciens]|uniref:Spy0128 family protein n=1 Tax=Adlercreutzia equolifaciens TaxID=446660 RepID=UPI003AF0C707